MALEPQGRAPPRLGEGRFLIVDVLGEGGTALVYLAWDDQENRWCAVKALQHKFLRDEEMRRRFAQEASALKLLAHPNVPRLFAEDQECSPPYMVMELARCGSTMDWVRDHGRMPPAMAADVMFQVCEALAEAHAAGIVHRDVKPHNFLLDELGHTKLTDFGIARVTDNTSMTATGSQIGTFSFMAPEQRSDTKSVDHRADIYSVGSSLYTLLTARTSAELFVADKDDDLLAEVPHAFREVILKSTRYKAEERYASVLELQTDLMSALSRIPPAKEDYPPLVRPAEPLPDRPPHTLPGDRRFDDLEKAMGLDGDQPTYVPTAEQRAQLEEAGAARKVIPYFMPSRPVVGTPIAEKRVAIPSYVDDSELGGMRRRQEAHDRAQLEAEVQAEVQRLSDPGPPPPPVDDPRARALGITLGALATLTLTVLITVLIGLYQLGGARSGATAAASALVDSVRIDGSVVYEIRGDRTAFEAIYQNYLDAEGAPRLQAALTFVDAIDAAVADTSSMEAGAESKVRRLQAARDNYRSALHAWDATANGLPGRLAVGLKLATRP